MSMGKEAGRLRPRHGLSPQPWSSRSNIATARTVIATRNIEAKGFRSVARASLAMSVE
jgi:hypothetical protein